MAGLIKRKNSWVALFSVAGKQIRKTTKIAVTPSVIPPGKSKMAVMRENEAKARLIAEELEKAANGERVDAEKVKREESAYKKIPVITDFTDEDGNDRMKDTVQANYRRIKEEVKQIVQDELERIAGDDNLKHLLQ